MCIKVFYNNLKFPLIQSLKYFSHLFCGKNTSNFFMSHVTLLDQNTCILEIREKARREKNLISRGNLSKFSWLNNLFFKSHFLYSRQKKRKSEESILEYPVASSSRTSVVIYWYLWAHRRRGIRWRIKQKSCSCLATRCL